MSKHSILNDYEAVKAAIERSSSLKETLINLGLRAAGGNYKALHKAAAKYNLTLPQFDRHSQVRSLGTGNKLPDEVVFCEDSAYTNRAKIKKRLCKDHGWAYKCMNPDCPNPEPMWAGKPLTIQLEHINGIHNDNRIENLMFLCPNCHSQTETFCGKSKPKPVKIKKPRPTKIMWPEVEELIRMVEQSNYCQVGLTLGVSDNAVRKRIETRS